MSTKALARIGGRAFCDFFRFKLKADGSGYDCLDKLTTTVVASPTLENAALSITEIVSTKPTPQDDGTIKVDWEHYECGEDVNDFLNLVAVPAAATGTKPEYNLQDGTKRGGSVSATDIIVPIMYGNTDADTATKIKIIVPAGAIDPTSGAEEWKNESYIAPSFTFTGTKLSKALTIPVALLRSDIVDTTGLTLTIPAGKGFWRGYVPVKTT